MKMNFITRAVIIIHLMLLFISSTSCKTREASPSESGDEIKVIRIYGEFSTFSPDNILQIINLPDQLLPRAASISFEKSILELGENAPLRTISDDSFSDIVTTDRVYFKDLNGSDLAIIFGESIFVREVDKWSVYPASEFWQLLRAWMSGNSIKFTTSKIEPVVLPLK